MITLLLQKKGMINCLKIFKLIKKPGHMYSHVMVIVNIDFDWLN